MGPAAAATKAATPAATALSLGTRFINIERAAIDFTAVQASDGAVRLSGFSHFDERKPARSAGIAVGDKIDTLNVSVRSKQLTDRGFGRGKIQIAHENVFHVTPSVLLFGRRRGTQDCPAVA
jgi:hypothetical protein